MEHETAYWLSWLLHEEREAGVQHNKKGTASRSVYGQQRQDFQNPRRTELADGRR